MSFIDWVNEQIQSRGWSYNELARQCGVSSTAISKLMTGKSDISFDMCMNLSRAFKMPPVDVLVKASLLPKPHPDNEYVDYVVQRMRMLDLGEQEEIAEFVDYKYQKSRKKVI